MGHTFRILASINQCISVFNESRSTAKDTDAHSSTWSSLLSGTLPGAWHPSTPFRPTKSRYEGRGRGSCGASFQQISLCYIVNGHVERHVWDSLDVIQCEASVETSTNPLLQHTQEVCETLKQERGHHCGNLRRQDWVLRNTSRTICEIAWKGVL